MSLHWKVNIATISHLNDLLGNCVGWSEALTSNQNHSFSSYTSSVNKPSHLPATVINVTICLHVNELSFSQVSTDFCTLFIWSELSRGMLPKCQAGGRHLLYTRLHRDHFMAISSDTERVILKNNTRRKRVLNQLHCTPVILSDSWRPLKKKKGSTHSDTYNTQNATQPPTEIFNRVFLTPHPKIFFIFKHLVFSSNQLWLLYDIIWGELWLFVMLTSWLANKKRYPFGTLFTSHEKCSTKGFRHLQRPTILTYVC